MENGNGAFEIRPAVRKAVPALIGLWGPSHSGKTYSALRIARGLVGPNGKIGMTDTENRRAEIYAGLVGGWDHLDLQPPFTPERYTQAFRLFESRGYQCVIVDSMSHVWEGEGGVLDMADNARTNDGRPMQGLAKWKGPKIAYKRMVNALLRAPFHVIFCLRAKNAVKQSGRGQEASIEDVGLEPICERNFIYEMTVSVLLGQNHHPVFNGGDGRFRCSPLVPSVKAPGDLWATIRPDEMLSESNGEAIAAWLGAGAPVDKMVDELVRVSRDVATLGLARLKQHWDGLDKVGKRALKPHLEELKTTAAEADAQAGGDPEFEPSDERPVPAVPADPLADAHTERNLLAAG